MRHAVIMAGGAGVRLWPMSRQQRPKQLLPLLDGKSLLRESVDRLLTFMDADRVYVITRADHLAAVAREVPDIPAENLFGEPTGRDTANAVGMAAALLRERDPDGTMGIFTADHIIRPQDRFADAVQNAYRVAEENTDALITFGIKPRSAHTGLGYVRRGDPLGPGVFRVKQFVEKPDAATAEKYVASGEYYWNSGMFVWKIGAILGELERFLPDAYKKVTGLAKRWHSDSDEEKHRIYMDLPKISIDFAVMEKAPSVLMVEMDCEWLDLGSWSALEEILQPDGAGNRTTGASAVTLDANRNLFVSDGEHLIAAIGVEDLVVVRTEDATLICRRNDAQRIKELAEMVKKTHGERYT